jgi:hypothetical protein
MNKAMKDAASKVADFITEQKEEFIRSSLIAHLGYLPTFSDMKKWGLTVLHPDGTEELRWRGQKIASHKPFPLFA